MWKSVQVICMIHVLKLLCSAPTVENEQGGGGGGNIKRVQTSFKIQ